MEREALGLKVTIREMESDLQRILRSNSSLEGHLQEAEHQNKSLEDELSIAKKESNKIKKAMEKVANYIKQFEVS